MCVRLLRYVLAASLVVTEGILIAEGRAKEALPLHLCSVAAIAALDYSFSARQLSLDFLWYLGMPGALLALIFPAPAQSRYQLLLNVSYVTTHLLILGIPLCALIQGKPVRLGQERRMLIALHVLAAAACFANRLLGTDFLFLVAPPAGTPLAIAYAFGYVWYLLTLEALACMWILAMGRLAGRIWPPVLK